MLPLGLTHNGGLVPDRLPGGGRTGPDRVGRGFARRESRATSELGRNIPHSKSEPVLTKSDIYFDLLEPFPVHPPGYQSVAPGKPRPIYPDTDLGTETLPDYTPTVYKVVLVNRKVEWVSPYEMAMQRHWQCCICELNSTQLNFYEYESPRTFDQSSRNSSQRSFLRMGRHSRQNSAVNSLAVSTDSLVEQIDVKDYRSVLTSNDDLERLHSYTNQKLLKRTNLIKSYSLQYGKVGLAIDYKKRQFTLRLRLESEQFLIEFSCVELMIEWYASLCLGIDNALDLSRRTMPKYRTVPRRGRRQRDLTPRMPLLKTHRGASLETVFRRSSSSLSLSNAAAPANSGFMSKLRRKLGAHGSLESVQPNPHVSFGLTDVIETAVLTDEDEADDEEFDNELASDNELDHGLELASDNELDTDLGLETDNEDVTDIISIQSSAASAIFFEAPPGTVPKLTVTQSGSSRSSRSPMTDTHVFTTTPSTSGPSETESQDGTEELIRKVTSYVQDYDLITIPMRRKVIRDAVRCMTPLVGNDRWYGRYMVIEAVPDYHPRMNMDPIYAQTRWRTVGLNYSQLDAFRPLQEYVVTPNGIIPRVNMGYERFS